MFPQTSCLYLLPIHVREYCGAGTFFCNTPNKYRVSFHFKLRFDYDFINSFVVKYLRNIRLTNRVVGQYDKIDRIDIILI